MKREHMESSEGLIGNQHNPMGKGKMMVMDQEMDSGMDELLAVLGYKVRYSDMADVAEKLEQLDRAMGCSATQEDTLISHLATDTAHYNPTDLSSWVENMMSELNNPSAFDMQPVHVSSSFLPSAGPGCVPSMELPSLDSSRSWSDRSPCPVGAGSSRFPCTQTVSRPRDQKRLKTSSSPSSYSTAFEGCDIPSSIGSVPASAGCMEKFTAVPILMIEDSQEAGICLVHALLACAEAVEQDNFKSADAIMKQISLLTFSHRGAMQKVAGYFAEALARRIYRFHPNQDCSLDSAFSDILQMHFYESCPYLKFAHFTANQAILEACAGFRRVHVIDFGMKQGMQWPALMQAFALRPGGPPSFRLTGIGQPHPENTDALQQVGWKLSQLAETLHINFEFRGLVTDTIADIDPFMLGGGSDGGSVEPEAVVINSIFELHGLLAIPGATEKVLDAVRVVRPQIMTVVEQEANHNSGGFVERFTESLHYYSTLFDSLEGGGGQAEQVMTEMYLGRQICNVVACEGPERTERHEALEQWRARMVGAGFQPVHLSSNAFKQASVLLALFPGGDGYHVEEREGCLTLGWHTRPLIATSAWRVADAGAGAVAIPAL